MNHELLVTPLSISYGFIPRHTMKLIPTTEATATLENSGRSIFLSETSKSSLDGRVPRKPNNKKILNSEGIITGCKMFTTSYIQKCQILYIPSSVCICA